MIKKALLLGMFLMISPSSAEIVHKMSSSVQLTVDAAASQASRIGSSYTVSGNNLKVSDGGSFGGLGTLTSGTAVGYTPFVDATSGTPNLLFVQGTDSSTDPKQLQATLWKVLSYTASDNEVTATTAEGTLWYNSTVDEADILVHNGSEFVGYLYD